MKKLSAVLFLVAGTFAFSNPALAQIKAGVGVIYGSDIEQVGFRVDALYKVNDSINLQGDIGYYLPKDVGLVEFNWLEVDVNLQYTLQEKANLRLYGIGGINYTSIEAKRTGFVDRTTNEIGLNVGGGAELGLPFANLFGEIKYVLGNADQLGVGFGARFSIF